MKTADKHKTPFIVPEGYLEGFTLRMMQRIDTSAPMRVLSLQKNRRKPVQYAYLRYALGAAAVMALFVVGMWTSFVEKQTTLPMAQTTGTSEQKKMASTDKDAVYYYLMMNEQTIYEYEASNE